MIQIYTSNRIHIDGRHTGLALSQTRERTVIYTPENRLTGQRYVEHKMPHERYSTAHDAPASGAAGRFQLEQDVRELMKNLAQ